MMTFHFEPLEREWTIDDEDDFISLMLTGSILPRASKEKEISTLAQSKVWKIGEKSMEPIDRVAMLVARKFTCRFCGELDFATKMNRRVHETQCKKIMHEREKAERRERANAKIRMRYLDESEVR